MEFLKSPLFFLLLSFLSVAYFLLWINIINKRDLLPLTIQVIGFNLSVLAVFLSFLNNDNYTILFLVGFISSFLGSVFHAKVYKKNIVKQFV